MAAPRFTSASTTDAPLSASETPTRDQASRRALCAPTTTFLREAEQLATEATEAQGLRNVVWRVVERDGHLYGVLYGERCD